MRAGRLTKRLTIQQVVRAQNAAGELVDIWETWATVWAAIEPLTGRERFLGPRLVAEVDTRIRIRYHAGVVATTMRGTYGGRVFDFLAVVAPRERHEELEIMALEQAA